MGFSSESNHGCKNHPNHQEKQGVCASCLREKLSRLCSVSSHKELVSRIAPSGSSSLSYSPVYYHSSASSSTSASPARQEKQRCHKRNGSDVMGSLSFMVKVGNGLKKSRSIAFVPRNFDEEEVHKNKKKKKGFWSKLLGFKGKKDVLTHSTSMRIIGRVF
ncbi:hypothetical protein COLO4_27295 [Corchorus olitorius]|uniref:Uncharacterized protein n=1 Tax=Corchorus olitorius TaxID=93759 RepID=A0A1R3HRW6_9ROSI|nr:hypothetical protein COLO4_27295 [Corchorus olitorius]